MNRRGFLALLGGLATVAMTQGVGPAEAAQPIATGAPEPMAAPDAARLDEAPADYAQYRYRRRRRVYYRRPRRVYRRVYYRRPVRRVYYRRPVRRVYYRRPVYRRRVYYRFF